PFDKKTNLCASATLRLFIKHLPIQQINKPTNKQLHDSTKKKPLRLPVSAVIFLNILPVQQINE
ncbi:MAG: hypothetical protein MI866_10805, partial [Bacteroidales bacterium]|nr:hypothetical protein [Bacteroidales bacterium]